MQIIPKYYYRMSVSETQLKGKADIKEMQWSTKLDTWGPLFTHSFPEILCLKPSSFHIA